MERKTKGIWIPIEVWEARDLSWNEKVLLMEVDSYTSVGNPCFISDEYIAELLGVGTSRAGQLVSSLVKKGYLRRAGFDGRRRFIETTIAFQCVKDCGAAPQKIAEQKPNNLRGRAAENCDIINQDNKTKNNTRENNTTTSATRFVVPTLDEVTAYCQERGNGIDPQSFIDHYTSNGWMVGKTKMKDWRACIRTWEARRRENPNPRPLPRQQQEGAFAAAERIMNNINRKYQNLQSYDEQ